MKLVNATLVGRVTTGVQVKKIFIPNIPEKFVFEKLLVTKNILFRSSISWGMLIGYVCRMLWYFGRTPPWNMQGMQRHKLVGSAGSSGPKRSVSYYFEGIISRSKSFATYFFKKSVPMKCSSRFSQLYSLHLLKRQVFFN